MPETIKRSNGVAWRRLKTQKMELVDARAENRSVKEEELNGIIHLLDFIQDELEDHGRVTLVVQEEDDLPLPLIEAEAHSDDHYYEIKFNAVLWFIHATDDEILALARCGWRGDYPSDAVAQWTTDHAGGHDGLQDLFKHIEVASKTGTMGFECSVSSDQAMPWLLTNRRLVHEEIMKQDKEEE